MIQYSRVEPVTEYKLIHGIKGELPKNFGKAKDKVTTYVWRYLSVNWEPAGQDKRKWMVEENLNYPDGSVQEVFRSEKFDDPEKAVELFYKRLPETKKAPMIDHHGESKRDLTQKILNKMSGGYNPEPTKGMGTTYEEIITRVKDVDDFNRAYKVIDGARNLTKAGRDYYIRKLHNSHPAIKAQAETAARQAFAGSKSTKGYKPNKLRVGGAVSVPERHQIKIAQDTLRMPDAMVGVMGGMTKAQARQVLSHHGIKPSKTPRGPTLIKKGGGHVRMHKRSILRS